VIPPEKNAVLSKDATLKGRNNAIKSIKKIGRKLWKEEVNYYKRSSVEVALFKYKTIIGAKINARKLENEKTEVSISCAILNVMTRLGMPVIIKIN